MAAQTYQSTFSQGSIDTPISNNDSPLWNTGITPPQSQSNYALQNEFQTWKTIGIVFIVFFAIFAVATIILMIVWISAKPTSSLNSQNPLNASQATTNTDPKSPTKELQPPEEEMTADDVANDLIKSFEEEDQDNDYEIPEDEDDFNSAKLLNNSVLTKTQAKKMLNRV